MSRLTFKKKRAPSISHYMFTYRLRELTNPAHIMKYVSEWYQNVFGRLPPLNKQPLELIKLKLAYEIMKREKDAKGIPLPPKVQQNHEAAQEFDIDRLTKDLRFLVKIKLEHMEEAGMKKAKRIKGVTYSKKELKTTVASVYLDIFSKQARHGLTDEQIAAEVKRQTGSTPTAKSVSSHRCYYNQGQIKGQTKKPALKVKAIRGKAEARPAAKPKKRLVIKKKGRKR